MEEKPCTGPCGKPKPVTEFHKNRRKADGLEPMCKVCTNARFRKAYAKNPAAKIARTRQYHLDHPEWSKKTLREWHLTHAARRYEDYKIRGQDPEVARKRRASTRRSESRRRAIKASVESVVITADEFATILDMYHHECWICFIGLSEDTLHWDHYQPLAAGGRHVPDNMRPACGPCNIRKNSIWPITEEHLDAIRRAVSKLRRAEEVMPVSPNS